MLTILPLLLCLLPGSGGAPSYNHDDMAIFSHLPSVPAGFVRYNLHERAAALPDELMQLTISMPQVNISGLHEALLDVSDPSSKNYRQYLTRREVGRCI